MTEENKYFTPDIEDIRVGYECEINDARGYKEDFEKTIIGYKIPGGYSNEISDIINMMDDGYGEVRVPFLTKEQIESFGFELKAKSIDSWFQIKEEKRFDTDLQNFCGYKAYNVFLNYGFHDRKLKIKADFSGGSDFSGAETLFEGECKCVNELRQILKQIHITPFYEEK